jgi:poly-gamma-glutamate capsule biosynthesis protein CapA/YwtB (metallophosphatase superfamily)
MHRYRGLSCRPVAVVLLGTWLTFGGAVVVAQQNAPKAEPPNFRSMNVADGFTIASVGDLIIVHPATQNPENKPLASILRSADVATGNMETVILDVRKNVIGAFNKNALWSMASEPSVAKDLKAMGITMVDRANNQTLDYGPEGMRETDRWLDEAGIVHAGDGETLGHARAARYLDTPKGRVAMVSMASTFDPAAIARNPNGQVPGLPGLNPVRTTRYVIVTADQMQALRKIQADSFPGGTPQTYNSQTAAQASTPVTAGPDEFLFFGTWYKVGDKPGYTYKLNPVDEREILQSIRNGKENSDFLVATIHSHEGPAPVDAIEKLAHEAIDAGADTWVGHGPHVLRGIEIYKGKPIFYSLGDFFFEVDLVMQPIPQAEYEGRSMDPAKVSDAEYSAAFWSPGRADLYESVIAVSRFDKNQLVDVRLYPVDLGWDRRPADRGSPRMASPEMAHKILEGLQKMSAPYGTTITIENNIGVIRVTPQANVTGQPKR